MNHEGHEGEGPEGSRWRRIAQVLSRVRFHLSTLVMVVLLAGALMAVWMLRNPWVCVGPAEVEDQKRFFEDEFSPDTNLWASLDSDNDPYQSARCGPIRIFVYPQSEGRLLCTLGDDSIR